MKKTKGERGIRALEEQFPRETVNRIRAIQAKLMAFPFRDGAGWYYAKELERCLEAGLLLASLHLATSFLELFVRDLLIHVDASDAGLRYEASDEALDNLEIYYEDATKPQWSFSKIVNELQSRKIIDSDEASDIRDYYEEIRIPIHHGLTRRFLRGERDSGLQSRPDDIFEVLFLGRESRTRTLEDRLESETIDLIEIAVAFANMHMGRLAKK